MKRMALLGLLVSATWGCSGANGDATGTISDPVATVQCGPGQTPLYSKVTPPTAGENGASGIGAAPSVLNGSGGGSSGGGGTSGGGTTGIAGGVGSPPSSGPASPAPAPTTSSPPTGTPFASTEGTCVPAVCPADQVAVPRLSTTGSGSGGVASGGAPSSGTTGVAGGRSSPPTTTPTPAPAPSTPSTTPQPGDVICTSPPPACPGGQAPSYAPAGFWHCLPVCDPKNQDLVVISYGGIYGNGGICAGPPPAQSCPVTGQVWTWNFLSEQWDCETECNNGQYDQRTYSGRTVCVPC